MLIPLTALIIGYRFLLITVPVFNSEGSGGDFSVLSYNVKWFVEARKDGGREEAIDWVADYDTEIKCFQEFDSRRAVLEEMQQDGFFAALGGRSNTLAIFSKYPIINQGILFSQENINNAMFADLVLPGDTLRIYNVHLESMGIAINEMSTTDDLRNEYAKFKSKFLNGSVQRAEQIEQLILHSESSPYRTIIVGDFNDIPYSYNHFQIRKHYANAFESVGRGFGFTFNGNVPFLRIDHQFYDKRLKVHEFKTYNDILYSDHFPIKAKYSILD